MAFNRKYTEKELNISNIHLHNLPERKFQNGKTAKSGISANFK